MSRRTFLLVAAGLLISIAPARLFAAERDTKPLAIHIISGSNEYKSEASLKEFMPWLARHYQVTWAASWARDGATELQDLDKLVDAEVMLVFARRLKLGEEQMKLVRAHWEAGKPIVALRTASHAFERDDNELFDRKIMGGDYKGHFGNEPVKVSAAEGQAEHPVLKGVGPFTSSKLYKAGQVSAAVLQHGDIDKARHPVTWVNTYNGGRVFYSSLGVPEDFKDKNFRRLLVNAVFWTAKRDPDSMRRGE